jgi:hypothetical protein
MTFPVDKAAALARKGKIEFILEAHRHRLAAGPASQCRKRALPSCYARLLPPKRRCTLGARTAEIPIS